MSSAAHTEPTALIHGILPILGTSTALAALIGVVMAVAATTMAMM